jgi:sugar diacid utilization regulator
MKLIFGCPAGVVLAEGRTVRMSSAGDRMPFSDSEIEATDSHSPAWASHQVAGGERVWIERDGAPHANDAMLLERFAIAVAITRSRAAMDSAAHRVVEVVVDTKLSADARAEAAARLRLDPDVVVRAIATPASHDEARFPSAVLSTRFGLARVVLVSGHASYTPQGPAGIGVAVEPDNLPGSWSSALVALRLADQRSPVVEADHLGALLLLAEAADADTVPHPDVLALDQLSPDRAALPTLDALTEEGSVRAAAAALGVHHSTVQARLIALVDALGYDPRTSDGRTRYVLARTLQRLRSTRF